VYWYLLHDRVPPPQDLVLPLTAGFFMAVAIGSLRTAVSSANAAIRVSRQSELTGFTGERPADGATVTIVGRIRAIGSPLQAPISGKPAVLYSYEIGRTAPARGGTAMSRDYSGYALTPSIIDSSFGPIRLMGFPRLDDVEKAEHKTPQALAKVTSYISSTAFKDMRGFNPGAIYREVKDLMTDDDGHVQKDWKLSDREDLSGSSLFEQMIAPGEQVCVTGRFSAQKGGVVPDTSGGTILRLMRGDARTAAGALWRKTAGALFAAIAVIAVVNAVIYFALRSTMLR
jgi:hypothetical protein